nr:beta-galactosidase [bacterium]
MENAISLEHITLGVCYYPEHWPQNMWEEDLTRMKALGLTTVRVAEFAWSRFEPTEGQFTFSFFDDFLDIAQKVGINVIFCTPTATPPAWLTTRYPEVLNAREDGVLYRHGLRRHYNYTSPVYREKCARIVGELARHYGHHPAIIGWQIDNEFNCEIDTFHAESDHAAFRAYLRRRFGTLDNLNHCMGLTFWNQVYTDWDEIRLSSPTPSGGYNPHMRLEETRFISECVIDFCRMQADILRQFIPKDQFITTNGLFSHINNHRMTGEALDFISFDSYPNFAFDIGRKADFDHGFNDRASSRSLAATRAISPNFAVMEQQSGPGGWVNHMCQPTPKPGQMRLWTLQSIAHGADYIGYFRWRTCWIGTEIYWHGINDHHNKPNRRLEEVARIRDDIARLEGVAGSRYVARMGFVRDYDNLWDEELDAWHAPRARASEDAWFEAAQLAHIGMDYVYLNEDTAPEQLAGYDLLVYPHPAIMTPARAALLKGYVEGGGTLIMASGTGYKDIYGRCPMADSPAHLTGLFGIRVAEHTLLSPFVGPTRLALDTGLLDAAAYLELLEPLSPDTHILARFAGGDYDGLPALTARRQGKGLALYMGSAFTPALAGYMLEHYLPVPDAADILDAPAEAEVAIRQKGEQRFIFVLNYKMRELPVRIKKPVPDVLSGRTLCGQAALPPFGVWVLRG